MSSSSSSPPAPAAMSSSSSSSPPAPSAMSSSSSLPPVLAAMLRTSSLPPAQAAMSSSSSSLPPAAPRPPPGAASKEEKLLRAVEKAIQRSYAAKKATNVSPNVSPNVSRWKRLFGKAMVIKESKNGPAASKSASAPPPAQPRTQQEQRERDKKGTDVPVGHPPEAGAKGDGVQVVQAAGLDRSGYAAVMPSTLARIQGGDVGEAITKMEQALKGLMDVSFRAKDPVLPVEFVSKLSRANESWSQRDIIADPLIMTSGHSIDRFSHQWPFPGTGQHLLTVPNHLLGDVIRAWCLDHAIPPPSSTSTLVANNEAPPSEEEMQLLLENLSMHSVEQQKEALHKIQLLSKFSKGVHPCLDQWQDLIPMLIGLHKNWKSTWTRNLEEERLTIMLNLSFHRPNQEILAMQEQLPDALKETIRRATKLQYPLTIMVKVSSLVTILSEYNNFRRKVVEIGGIKKLGKLLHIKDALVRNEASAAILALCTDDTEALSLVPHASLVECLSDGVVTDDSLVLLDCTSYHDLVRDCVVSKVVFLMEVVTKHGSGYVTSRGIQAAVGLIHHVIHGSEAMGRLQRAPILQDFLEVLRNLERKEMPPERVYQTEGILIMASNPSLIKPFGV